MSRNAWHGLTPAKELSPGYAPQHISKQEFGRRLYEAIIKRGWNQSELARRARIGRDSVSSYVRGISFPDPKNLQSLADALDCKKEDLLSNIVENAMDREHPAFEIKAAHGDPNNVWLRVNRMVSADLAAQIFTLINKEDHAKAGDER